MPEGKVVVVERGKLHRVLEQARPRGEPRTGHVRCARVVLRQTPPDALEVEAAVIGHHVELVRRRELYVPPHVREQLGELRFLWRQLDDAGRQHGEELRRPLQAARGAGRDDLRELEQLGHRLALGDPLRAERHLDLQAEVGDQFLHPRRGTWKDRGAQYEQLTVAQVLGAAAECSRDNQLLGVEVFVHRGADHHYHVLGGADHRRICAGAQPALRYHPLKNRLGAWFVKRQPRGVYAFDGRLAEVVDGYAGAALGKRNRQRQADVPASPYDNDIVLK